MNTTNFPDDAPCSSDTADLPHNLRERMEAAALSGVSMCGIAVQGADLRCAKLRGADLRAADLRGVDLRGADLSECDLRGAYLHEACLQGADLYKADARGADFNRADLRSVGGRFANFRGALLRNVAIDGADLRDAELLGADLLGSDIHNARTDLLDLERASILPAGELIGWKKCDDGALVKLRIPASARRTNAFGRACRAECAVVLAVEGPYGERLKTARSIADPTTTYRPGITVRSRGFGANLGEAAAEGIHFFINKSEAAAYW